MWCRPNAFRRSSQNYSRNSRVLEKGKYLDLWWYWSFYSSRRLISLLWSESIFLIGIFLINPKTWWTSYSLIEKIFINARIFQNPLCARILISLGFHLKECLSKHPQQWSQIFNFSTTQKITLFILSSHILLAIEWTNFSPFN